MSYHIDQAARKIEELEDAITANDEYLQRLQKSHAELLMALQGALWCAKKLQEDNVVMIAEAAAV